MTEYEEVQKVKYKSFESGNEKWAAGQERCIKTWVIPNIKKGDRILDCACGDGVGLKVFQDHGFHYLMGIEFEPEKAFRANRVMSDWGYVIVKDFHIPYPGWRGLFNTVYSSHSLEHAHDPVTVLMNFHEMLVPGGQLFLILPFPDAGPDDAHCGKKVLGTGSWSGLATLWDVLEGAGFELQEWKLDSWREPEVWVRARKV